jgi:hypothetical protein
MHINKEKKLSHAKIIKIIKESNCIDKRQYNSHVCKTTLDLYIFEILTEYTILKKTDPSDIDEITACNDSVNTS